MCASCQLIQALICILPPGNNWHSPPRELSPEQEFPAPPDPPIANRSGNVEDMVVVPDAESDPNLDGIFHDPAAQCHNHDVVMAAQEISSSQNIQVSALLFGNVDFN